MVERRSPWWSVLLLVLMVRGASAEVQLPQGFRDDRLVTGLNWPRAMAFLPDGRVLVTEQHTGAIRLITDLQHLVPDPILVVPGLNGGQDENGLQGITIDPRWPGQPFVYLCYNHTGQQEWIVRYRASGLLADPHSDNLSLGDPLVLLGDLPDVSWSHNGGCLRFGIDSLLYASLGDDGDVCAAQDSSSLKGCLLRLEVRHLPAAGGSHVSRADLTPLVPALATADSNARLVYAYGFRNPWVFSVDPGDGNIYVADVGDFSYEEIDQMKPGGNYGWPFREGPYAWDDLPCEEPGGYGGGSYQAPIIYLPHPNAQAAISMAACYHPSASGDLDWDGDYDGDMLWGEYFSGSLRLMKRDGSGGWTPAPRVEGQPDPNDWATGLVASVDYAVGADGSLYWLRQYDPEDPESGGAFSRISPVVPAVVAPGTVHIPPLRVTPNPAHGPVEVAFALPAARAATLEILDLAGRRVRAWREPAGEAGARTVRWDGRDESGRRMAAGVYLVRLASAGSQRSTRFCLLR